MITYNNTLIEYFKANDTEFKKLLNKEYEKSNISSFIQYMDAYFAKLGIISTNIIPIEGAKWNTQYTLGIDNLFSKEPDTIVVTNIPVSRKEAEGILATKVIALLSTIDMNEIIKLKYKTTA